MAEDQNEREAVIVFVSKKIFIILGLSKTEIGLGESIQSSRDLYEHFQNLLIVAAELKFTRTIS